MPATADLARLWAEYLALDQNRPHWPTDDQLHSLTYFREELRAGHATSSAASRSRVSVWVDTVIAVEAFVDREGRLPRENNRAVRGTITAEERRLADWIRYQRRQATRVGHCDYQRRRLECIPGFLWDPRGDQWDVQFAEFARFVATHHHAPRYRSDDSHEKGLAAWAAKQREFIQKGTLPPRRLKKLRSLSFRIAGPTKKGTPAIE